MLNYIWNTYGRFPKGKLKEFLVSYTRHSDPDLLVFGTAKSQSYQLRREFSPFCVCQDIKVSESSVKWTSTIAERSYFSDVENMKISKFKQRRKA